MTAEVHSIARGRCQSRSGNAERAHALQPNVCSVAFHAIPKFRFVAIRTVLATLLVCFATYNIFAQVAGSPGVADTQGTRSSLPQAPLQNVRELKPGRLISGELTSGEMQRFSVMLKAGEYMTVVVNQQGRFSWVQALDPAGRAIAQINVGGTGPGESLWALAEVAGEYQVKISAPKVKGYDGPYTISLERVADSKTASSSEQDYLKAHRLLFEGHHLLDNGDDQSLRHALEDFQEALQLWRQLGERAEEAYTLHEVGYVWSKLKDQQKALEFYSQAVSIWEVTNNHQLDEASTLYNLGNLYSSSGKTASALECYQRAIEFRRSKGDKGPLAFALTNLGQLYINIGEFEAALKSHQEALALRRELEDLEGEARSLSNISGVYFRLGELQEALNYSLQALPVRRKAEDHRGEAITLNNIGTTYRELGEPQKALGYYQQALSLMHRLDAHRQEDPDTEAIIFTGMGRSFYDLGNYASALDNYNQSLTLGQTSTDPYAKAATLTNIGKVNAQMGNREKALAYFGQSLQLQRAINDRRGQVLTLQKTGEVYQESGDLKKAREYFDEGLTLSRSIKNRACEANLLYDIALNEQSAGHPAEARAQVEAAIAIVESARAAVANSDLRASYLASKQEFYELDIDLLMQKYLKDGDQQSLLQAFGVSEQRRARSLLDNLEGERGNIRGVVSSDLILRERDLRAKLNQKAESQIKLLSGAHTPEQANALALEVERAATDYEQLLANIKISDPRYAALTQSLTLTARELQTEILDSDTLLLEYSLGKDRSYLWAVTKSEIKGYELPSQAEIEKQTRNIYSLLTARDRFIKFEKTDERQARIAKADAEYLQTSSRLSRVLLGPVVQQLEGKHLLIVSDGALQYLPFSALPSPSRSEANSQATNNPYRPLIADHGINNLPSASILGILRRESSTRKSAPKAVAVLADPVFSKLDERVMRIQSIERARNAHAKEQQSPGNDGSESQLVRAVRDIDTENQLELDRLPSTGQEAEAILKLAPKADRFSALGFDANRSAATSPKLGQYRIVHFATHGLLNSAHPGLSGLVFSLVDRQGHDQNGFLTTQDIFNLNLPAELVVLSGCRTGLGKEIKGEGMLGLTRAFMYAGAARLAVSLWDVNDESTAVLMAKFYSGMLGKKRLNPSSAIREAQVEMWKSNRWSAPYYWAAFVLQGEYR
jgi:CHAT domain-containing protein/tetratricopeptide (TPR) repeat protein